MKRKIRPWRRWAVKAAWLWLAAEEEDGNMAEGLSWLVAPGLGQGIGGELGRVTRNEGGETIKAFPYPQSHRTEHGYVRD